MGKVIRKTWDEMMNDKISPERLAEMAATKDEGIDVSDIPPLTEKFWQNAVQNPFYRPVKTQVTVRVDADVLAWLRNKSEKGYQTKLNSVLREAMLKDVTPARKRA
jgi:uncharacterized protein (DUF4415 family)